MFWRMWIGTLDLDETFRANPLVAASCLITEGRIVDEANGTFKRIFVEKHFNALAVNIGISAKLYLGRANGFAGLF